MVHHHQESMTVSSIEPAKDAKLEGGAHASHQNRRRDEGDPEIAGPVHGGIPDIGAQHEEGAMGKVDDTHDAEDQRQATTEEEQQRGLRQRVETLGNQERQEIHQPS
jgi:hypothetical protein